MTNMFKTLVSCTIPLWLFILLTLAIVSLVCGIRYTVEIRERNRYTPPPTWEQIQIDAETAQVARIQIMTYLEKF